MGAKYSSERKHIFRKNKNEKKHCTFYSSVDSTRYRIINSEHNFKLENINCTININVIKNDDKQETYFNSTNDVCIDFVIVCNNQKYSERFTDYPGIVLSLQHGFCNMFGVICTYQFTQDDDLCIIVTDKSTTSRFILKKSRTNSTKEYDDTDT